MGRLRTISVGLGFVLAACSGSAEPNVVTTDALTTTAAEDTTTTEPPPTTTTEPPPPTLPSTTTTSESVLGSFDNPAPAGATAEFGDWDVTYIGAHVGTDEVLAENQFNDPPEDGWEFVLMEFEATYTGDESGNFWIDFTTTLVGGQGNTFDDYCGVIPNDISDTGETFPGGTVTGYECVPAPVDQFDGAKVSVEVLFTLIEERVFYEAGLSG